MTNLQLPLPGVSGDREDRRLAAQNATTEPFPESPAEQPSTEQGPPRRDMARALRRWWPLIAVCTVASATLGYFWAGTGDPTYSATAVISLLDDETGNSRHTVSFEEMEAQRLVLTSSQTRAELRERLGEQGADLQTISASTDEDTTLIDISITATTSTTASTAITELIALFTSNRSTAQTEQFGLELAQLDQRIVEQQTTIDNVTALANNTARPAAEQMASEGQLFLEVDRMHQLIAAQQELRSEISLADGRVALIDQPQGVSESKRNQPLTAVQAGLLGLLLAAGAVVALVGRSDTLHSVEELEGLGGLPVIAAIPRFARAFRDRPNAIVVGRAEAQGDAEAFRFIRTAVELATPMGKSLTVALTSTSPGEGKTVTAGNLAVAMAAAGQRTLLVDGDLLSSSLPDLSGMPEAVNTLPLAITGHIDLASLTTSIGPPGRELDVLISTAASAPEMDRLEMTPTALRRAFRGFQTGYDGIVVDSPPALVVADAVTIAAAADAVIVVARLGKVTRRELERTIDVLDQANAKILGLVATHSIQHGSYAYDYGPGGRVKNSKR